MNLVIDFFLIGGLVVNGIILWMLFTSSQKKLPQKLLILFFATLFLYILHSYSDFKDIRWLWIVTFVFNDILELFLGPILLIYVKSLFENDQRILKSNWKHFIPLGIYTITISIPLLISMIKNEFIFEYLDYFNDHRMVAFCILMAYMVGYLVITLKTFLKYRSVMELNFSYIGETELLWVRNMLLGAVFVSSIALAININELITGNDGYYDFIIIILVVILITYLGYYGVKQSKILLPDFLIDEVSTSKNASKKTTALTSFSDEELQLLQEKVHNVLQMDKVYLDEDLTLTKLADTVATSNKKLSELLNKRMNTTFYDIINKYRVEAVKEKIQQGEVENYTLLGIAFDCGFKSKTSFNRIFKKETGLSPSQFKKTV